MFRFPPSPKPVEKHAMTLVEVMMAFAVFAIAVVGGLGAIIFSLRNVETARTESQVTQILINELEAMRMRRWSVDRPVGDGSLVLTSISGFAAAPDQSYSGLPSNVKDSAEMYFNGGTIPALPGSMKKTTFVPFSVYGVSPDSGNPVATVGKEVLRGTPVQIRNATGYTCERYASTFTAFSGAPKADVQGVLMVLRVQWTDNRGVIHSRALSTVILSNGLTEQLYRF